MGKFPRNAAGDVLENDAILMETAGIRIYRLGARTKVTVNYNDFTQSSPDNSL
jgi:hypothetical protein